MNMGNIYTHRAALASTSWACVWKISIYLKLQISFITAYMIDHNISGESQKLRPKLVKQWHPKKYKPSLFGGEEKRSTGRRFFNAHAYAHEWRHRHHKLAKIYYSPDSITAAVHPALANITANHWCCLWISIDLKKIVKKNQSTKTDAYYTIHQVNT